MGSAESFAGTVSQFNFSTNLLLPSQVLFLWTYPCKLPTNKSPSHCHFPPETYLRQEVLGVVLGNGLHFGAGYEILSLVVGKILVVSCSWHAVAVQFLKFSQVIIAERNAHASVISQAVKRIGGNSHYMELYGICWLVEWHWCIGERKQKTERINYQIKAKCESQKASWVAEKGTSISSSWNPTSPWTLWTWKCRPILGLPDKT